MKYATSALLFAFAFSAMSVFADAANTLITFSTPGPDKYADGVTVVDGERYALVWTNGEDFKGFTTEGEAVDPSQKVIYKAPLAKDGRCPLTLFQIDSAKAPVGGVYSVYLLDTRGSAEQIVVTGSALAKTYKGAGGTANIAAAGEVDNTVNEAGEAVALKSTAAGLVDKNGLAAPVITGFKVGDADVTITVSNIFPGFVYEVKGGLDKKSDVKFSVEPDPDKDNTLVFTVGAESAKFFSINAK